MKGNVGSVVYYPPYLFTYLKSPKGKHLILSILCKSEVSDPLWDFISLRHFYKSFPPRRRTGSLYKNEDTQRRLSKETLNLVTSDLKRRSCYGRDRRDEKGVYAVSSPSLFPFRSKNFPLDCRSKGRGNQEYRRDRHFKVFVTSYYFLLSQRGDQTCW